MFEIFMYSGLGLVVVFFIATFFMRQDSSDEDELVEKYATKLIWLCNHDLDTRASMSFIIERHGRKVAMRAVERAMERDSSIYLSDEDTK